MPAAPCFLLHPQQFLSRSTGYSANCTAWYKSQLHSIGDGQLWHSWKQLGQEQFGFVCCFYPANQVNHLCTLKKKSLSWHHLLSILEQNFPNDISQKETTWSYRTPRVTIPHAQGYSLSPDSFSSMLPITGTFHSRLIIPQTIPPLKFRGKSIISKQRNKTLPSNILSISNSTLFQHS